MLGLLFGVEVVQVAEELVEAVIGGQVFVTIAQMVLAKLSGGVSKRLEELGDRGIFRLDAFPRAGKAHLGQAGTQGVLARYERGTAGRTA